MQVGDKVWIFDNNHRVYEDKNGNRSNYALYSGHFREFIITGETKQSWVIGSLKVNKKTLEVKGHALDPHLFLSQEEVNENCWVHENKYDILKKIERSADYGLLKEIERLLNSR